MKLRPFYLTFLHAIAAVGAVDLNLPPGVWTFRGYGFVLLSHNNTLTAYEESAISCLSNDGLLQFLLSAEIEGDMATVWVDGPIAPYIADRTDDFQEGCQHGPTPQVGDTNYTRDALLNFDIVDTVFQEHYAFFDLRNIDWEEITATARASLTPNSTNEELQDALVTLFEPLNDGHVYLASDTFFYSSKGLSIYDQLQEEFDSQNATTDPEAYQQEQMQAWTASLETYTLDGLNGDPYSFDWGKIERTDGALVGYMRLQDFDPENEDDFFSNLDDALSEFASADAVIVDIRINSGGDDRIGLEVASRFASERTLAFTKRTRYGAGFTEDFSAYIEACQTSSCFDGQVIVLASGSTVSAAEAFTISMAQLPQVTIVGENTLGALSDMLRRSLPNGWIFTLSNQEYRDPVSGTAYEMNGFPPDVYTETPLLPLAERKAGRDSWLELALEQVSAADLPPPPPPSVDIVASSATAVATTVMLGMFVAVVATIVLV